MSVAEGADASNLRKEFFSFNLYANSSSESFDKLRSRTRLFNSFWGKWMWSIIIRTTSSSSSCSSTLEAYSSLMSGSSPKIGSGISITMSYRTTCWLKIRILEAAPVLSDDPSHINSAEVAASNMVCRLPPNHGNSKVQTPLAISPPMQSPCVCLAHHVCCPSFILVSKFNTKISMLSTRYETCDWLPIRSNGVFSTYVAEYVELISAQSSGRSHLIHLKNKNRYKLVIN